MGHRRLLTCPGVMKGNGRRLPAGVRKLSAVAETHPNSFTRTVARSRDTEHRCLHRTGVPMGVWSLLAAVLLHEYYHSRAYAKAFRQSQYCHKNWC